MCQATNPDFFSFKHVFSCGYPRTKKHALLTLRRQNHLALKIGVPARRINEIVLGKRRITADTALRLARYFGTSARFWLGLQMDYDLDVAADVLGQRLEREVAEFAAAG